MRAFTLAIRLGDPGGSSRDAHPLSVQFLSFSCSFWQKPYQIISFCLKSRVGDGAIPPPPPPQIHLGNPQVITRNFSTPSVVPVNWPNYNYNARNGSHNRPRNRNCSVNRKCDWTMIQKIIENMTSRRRILSSDVTNKQISWLAGKPLALDRWPVVT